MAYNILDLGSLNKNLSVAFAITNCGQVAGWVDSPVPPATLGAPVPFVWTQGFMHLLPLAGPAVSGQAFDLNGQGQVVGNTYNTVVTRATRWQGGVMQLLPFLGDVANGRSINDCGSVAGDGATVTNIQAWCDPGGRLNPIPPSNSRQADRYCRAYGISNRESRPDRWRVRYWAAYLFSPCIRAAAGRNACLSLGQGHRPDLGTLHANEGSEAYGINDKKQVVGRSGNHAFLWHNGAMTDLGAGAAYNINSNAAVIGDSFLWHGGARTALTALLPANSGWSSLEGRDINDNGEIVGTGVHSGNTRAFLMWP